MKNIATVIFLVLLILFGAFLLGNIKVPEPAVDEIPAAIGHVNDFADVLSPEKEQELESFLEGKNPEIAVLTIKTTGGEPIESYAIRVANNWGVGDSATDDGVLFVIATEDRQMRVEIGSGAEGSLTDAQAGRILDEHVVPELKNNNWEAGISNGVIGLWSEMQK